MSEEKLCSYCNELFVLPDPAIRFLKYGGNGSEIVIEKRGRTELVHRLLSAKRTALIKKRTEQKFQILKMEKPK
jgi:hypothetical protein